jgi:hypothetical protein
MKHDSDKAALPEREPFTVSSFRPEDADGIVRLFRDVYGEGYQTLAIGYSLFYLTGQ